MFCFFATFCFIEFLNLQQQLSMNVPDADGLDHNTIALHGQYDQDFDNGDGDVFANQSVASGAMNMNKVLEFFFTTFIFIARAEI